MALHRDNRCIVSASKRVAILVLCGFSIQCASAQRYPVRPIRVVVTAPPSGGTDLVARLIGTKFQEMYGVPWIIDNRGGANGIIGTDLIAKSAADGYNVVMVYVSHS